MPTTNGATPNATQYVPDGKLRVTYNEVHKTIGTAAERIQREFRPDIMIAIGGGGFFPARVLRTFLRTPGSNNIPIQAIGLSLYEELPNTTAEQLGKEVIRTQWLDFSTLGQNSLLGKKVLIVDEVDDSRTTLSYALAELQKDVKAQIDALPSTTSKEDRERAERTEFAIFVVHNKVKPKAGTLPSSIHYFAGGEIPDVWADYPWETKDIDEHDRRAAIDEAARKQAAAEAGKSA